MDRRKPETLRSEPTETAQQTIDRLRYETILLKREREASESHRNGFIGAVIFAVLGFFLMYSCGFPGGNSYVGY
jgi:hypothetical protein